MCLDVCKYAIFFKKLYYSKKIFLDWMFLFWLWVAQTPGKGWGREGPRWVGTLLLACKEEANRCVNTAQTQQGFFQVLQMNTANILV